MSEVLTTTSATHDQEVRARQIISSALDQSVVNKVVHCTTTNEILTCLQSPVDGIINNVYYVPELTANLLSISSCAKDEGIFTYCTDSEVIFKKEDEEIFRGKMQENDIYKIDLLVKNASSVCYLSATLDDWHQRLGHVEGNNQTHGTKQTR